MKQNKLNIVRILKRFTVNRKHKDRLFQRVFADKKDLLDLYNAINGTDYTDPDELEITTLEDVIYMSMKNDMSFIVSSTLNLYEHQSTFTMEEAVDNAVDLCIKENILADILIKCRSEVSSMLLTEFDEKLYKKSIYKEGYEDGVSEGYERGMDEGYERGVDEGHRRGVSEGYGRGMDEAREQAIMNSISMLRSIGISDDRIASLIAENYSIQKEEILNILKKDK